MSDHGRYVNPLSERYISRRMQYIFSPNMKFRTQKKPWIVLAGTEKELGFPITDEQIEELKAHSEKTNYDMTKAREKEVHHDVMSHVYAYDVQCPKAKGITRLGAASCYVGDNTDIVIMTEAPRLVKKRLIDILAELFGFAEICKDLPALVPTHFQPAQSITVGKYVTPWMMELKLDLDDLDYLTGSMRLLGSRGITGIQAGFLELFDGDHEKCHRLNARIAEKMGFKGCCPVPSRTYSRKMNSHVINVLAGIAQSTRKFSNDIRLLQYLKEVEESLKKKQTGSSAMAYKRSPTCSERIAPLVNYVMSDTMSPVLVASVQWFEKTLDDPANKGLSVPEGFPAVDGILGPYLNVVDGLVVYPKVIEKHLMVELPSTVTENIMMDTARVRGDRQELHERAHELSMEAGKSVKEKGLDNSLLGLITANPASSLSLDKLRKTTGPSRCVGRSLRRVGEFLGETIKSLLEESAGELGVTVEINVQVM